jgi:hypothetical protein
VLPCTSPRDTRLSWDDPTSVFRQQAYYFECRARRTTTDEEIYPPSSISKSIPPHRTTRAYTLGIRRDQGVPLNLDKPVFSAVGCDGVSFDWVNDYTLQIHYETTCFINQFTNRWSRPSDVVVGRANPIEIILVRS